MTRFFCRHWPFILIALVFNGLVLTNSILHYPKIGYDVSDNLKYTRVLNSRLPTRADTVEFFAPPLPFFLPSLVNWACTERHHPDCLYFAGKAAQILNFLLSLGITFLFWKIAELLKPGNEIFKASMLAILGIVTVYYKTFSQARGEPYVAFFIALLMFLVLKLLLNLSAIGWKDGLALGAALGGCMLSRQWAVLVFPALVVLFLLVLPRIGRAGWTFFRILLIAGGVAMLVGGWFYLHLFLSYGSFAAFNMKSSGFSFTNKPASFYTTTGLKNALLFTDPIRPVMDNTLFPIFYSETWGDYWGYFSFIRPGQNSFRQNNSDIASYLGETNLVSIFPSLVLLAGLVFGAAEFIKAVRLKGFDPQTFFCAFVFAAVLFSGAGYLWFLISYVGDSVGNTNKATYMIQIFIFLPVLAAFFLDRLRRWNSLIFYLVIAGLILVFIHNLPVMITHYIP